MTRMALASLAVGLVVGVLLAMLVIYVVSGGRAYYIFTTDSYKCGAVNLRMKENALYATTPDVTSLYDSAQQAGAALHGCGQPNAFTYGGKTYTLQGGTYVQT